MYMTEHVGRYSIDAIVKVINYHRASERSRRLDAHSAMNYQKKVNKKNSPIAKKWTVSFKAINTFAKCSGV